MAGTLKAFDLVNMGGYIVLYMGLIGFDVEEEDNLIVQADLGCFNQQDVFNCQR